ncbi:hypothetical protein H2199_004630 [Coniosporium tulheliwenetii]|uniref:Uncharacterized protein n=1 Tax=Coniosporium tulheliwenetii TaxID=3383036 RepID=A0ACC2Z6A5_9PEZI|nr:hypothetical protein H2199_004630 [Cladosporium sp. JES 115]
MASTVKERPSFLTFTQKTVTVEVGGEKKPFIVHKDLLCYWSKYFDKALNGPFKEGGKDTIAITDVPPVVFARFLQWLYAQPSMPLPGGNITQERVEPQATVDTIGSTWRLPTQADPEGHIYTKTTEKLLELYILGDRYDIRDLMKDVMSALMIYGALSDWVLAPETAVLAFDNLPRSSPFCRYVVYTYAYAWRPKPNLDNEVRERNEAMPPELLYEVMTINIWRVIDPNIEEPKDLEDPCRYHDHDDEARWCRAQLPQRMMVWNEIVNRLCVDD